MMNERILSFPRAVGRALLSLLLGLLLGALAMIFIAWLKLRTDHPEVDLFRAAEIALREGLLPLLTGGGQEGLLPLLGRAAPAALLALGVSLAWQGGMLQLGGAGQYALGAAAAMLCGSPGGLPWYVCLIAAALAGALWGALPGVLKACFHLRTALGTALSTWLALYALQAFADLLPWEQLRETVPFLPPLAISAAFALILWLFLRLTVPGLEIRLLGVSEKMARYAGVNTAQTAFLALCLSGLLGGAAGGLSYALDGVNGLPDLSWALTGPGLYGLTAAALAAGHPIGAVGAAVGIGYLSMGADTMNSALFTRETGEAVLALILFCCACLAPRRGKGGEEE